MRCKRELPIVEFARSIRSEDPGIGARKIWLMAGNVFGKRMIGRDAFYALLEREGMRLRRPRPRHTTNSNHRYHKYQNMIKDFVPNGANQLWVSDITYIQLADGSCCYLHLVTDAYSHKIVGWCISPTLEARYTLDALREAISQAQGYDLSRLIHHSDRGVQYCCNAYVEELNSYSISVSMTEDYKPTNNGIAERVNGIIKTEKLYRQPLYANIEDARDGIGKFICFYNERRPHMSIGYQTPSKVHEQSGPQARLWKGYQPPVSTV
jgi:transposase InsO family protein